LVNFGSGTNLLIFRLSTQEEVFSRSKIVTLPATKFAMCAYIHQVNISSGSAHTLSREQTWAVRRLVR